MESPSSSTNKLPVIDLKLLEGDSNHVAAVLDQWNKAFQQFGFCYVTSHGLEDLYEAVEQSALQFFLELTPEEKNQYYLQKGYGHGGYVAPGIERVEASRNNATAASRPDPVESLCVHDSVATHVPPFAFDQFNVPYKHGSAFKGAVQKLWYGLEALLRTLMNMSAQSLQLDSDYFDGCYRPGANFLRLAHYVKDDNNESNQEQQRGQLRYGEHTDYQGFTVLWRNQSNGLQCASNMREVVDRNQPISSWMDIPLLEDNPHALVINAGDLIQRWSNDYWISNVHRVTNNRQLQHPEKEPLSIVFFTGPEHETVVEKLPSPLLNNVPAKYKAVTAGDHLKQKIEPTNGTTSD